MSFQNHILNTTSTQEVDGCSGDGNVAAMSWSENGGKIENGVSQMDSVTRITYQVLNSFSYLQKGSKLYWNQQLSSKYHLYAKFVQKIVFEFIS